TSTCPAPSHASHRPPATLNENVLGVYALARASGSAANRARSSSNALMYVMGLERGVRPMGAWSTSTTSLIACQPSSARTSPTGRPLVHELAPRLAACGAQLHHPVGGAHGGRVVLDYHDGVAAVGQPPQQAEQPAGIRGMQADGRLVEHVQGVDEVRAQGVG